MDKEISTLLGMYVGGTIGISFSYLLLNLVDYRELYREINEVARNLGLEAAVRHSKYVLSRINDENGIKKAVRLRGVRKAYERFLKETEPLME